MPLADLLSIVRIPLGAAFVVVAGRPFIAVWLLILAGLSDVLDGWAARRHRHPADDAPHRGDWLDPLCDKVFVAAVMAGLLLHREPPVLLVLLTVTREILQTVSMIVYKLLPPLRRMTYPYRAHPIGKATTVTQFVTCVALLFRSPAAAPLAWACAVLGLVSVAVYLGRARALVASRHP